MSEQSGPPSGLDRPGEAPEAPQAPGPVPGPGPMPPGTGMGPADPRGRRAMWLGVIGLPLLVTPLLLVGAALSTTAFVLGVKAKRQAGRTHGTAPGATVGVVTGLLGMGVFIVSMILGLTMLREITDYQTCMQRSNTITDEQQCRDHFNKQLEHKLHIKSSGFVSIAP